jgi:threonine/homoserine/homoserine lactone efflux protein
MKLFKLLFALVVLFLAVLGAFALFGLVAVLFKWLVILGVVALLGVGAYKLLSGPDEDAHAALSPAEAELMKAERMLAELRRKELTK